MIHAKRKPRYPQNIYLKELISISGMTITDVARNIGYNRSTVSETVNGHYLGRKIVPLIETLLSTEKN